MPHVPWQKCIECNKVVENPRPINSILLKLYLSARTQLRIDSTCYVCKACRSKFDRWHHKVKGQVDQLILDKSSNENDYELEVNMDIDIENNTKYTQTSDEIRSIEIAVNRCSKDERSCIVCGEKNIDKRTRLNEYQRNILFIKRGIYVSPGARCCGDHFYKGQLTYEAIHQIVPFKSELVTFNSNEIQKIITDFRALVQNQEAFDFDNNASLDDTAYYNSTGLLKSMISHD
ncbi:unnamed protein product [Rotaria sp. Silwood1]|nr:unnamed protein product [Rotaria sp. Silwood1]CAF5104023.1 unnamed protein product [Rotaria sp. Silwood1]